MKKTIYKKGDAKRGSTAPAAPVPAPHRAAAGQSSYQRSASATATLPPPARRTVSAAGARVHRAAAQQPAHKRSKGPSVPLVLGLSLALIAAAAAGAIALHSMLEARQTADAPADAESVSQPLPTAAPQPAASEAAESQPEETLLPEAEPTLADKIRAAGQDDPNQWPTLAEALSGSENAAFLAIDLASGQTLAWQPDASIYIASAIKAPYALYVCRQLDAGNLADDEPIEYLEQFYDEGAGSIKNSEPGTVYRLDYLLQEALLRSDNIAYRLLVNRCGKEDFNALMDSLGITEGLHFTATNIWPKATPRELALAWSAILDYIQSDAAHSALLRELLTSSLYSPIRRSLGSQRTVASKYGWDTASYTDAGIVYSAEGQPQYLLVILTENGNLEDGGALNATAKIIKQIDAILAPAQ